MVIGRVESLWRYPVKSMRGEQLDAAYFGFAGVYGDRRYAFLSSAAPDDFPYMTGREKHDMLLHRAVYQHPERMQSPARRAHGDFAAVEVETPAGERLAIEDPRLIDLLCSTLRARHQLTMIQSDAAITDSRPVSIFSLQTVRQLSHEVEWELDKRRFRANIYVDLASGEGFGEDRFLGCQLSIGKQAVVEVVKRNERCKMITLDPDTAEASPEVMRCVAREHQSCAGIYAAVVTEGLVFAGDEMRLLQ